MFQKNKLLNLKPLRLIIVFLLITFFCAFIVLSPKWLTFFGVYILQSDINKNLDHISLTVGQYEQLSCFGQDVFWQSDNPGVFVCDNGVIYAPSDLLYSKSQAFVTAYENTSKDPLCNFKVTIVPWTANKSNLEILDVFPKYNIIGWEFYPPHSFESVRLMSDIFQYFLPPKIILGADNINLFYSLRNRLYKTSDGFQTSEFISKLPFVPGKGKMLITPFGYFMRSKKNVYASNDLLDWKVVFKTQLKPALLDNMDYWYDIDNGIGYLYIKEYSVKNPDQRHNLYRGIFNSDGSQDWSVIYSLYSLEEQQKNNNFFIKSGRHFHLVKVDPYTGNIYVGTGDEDRDSMILYSTDYGNTFKILGFGRQDYRTLGFWFSENYIYWNMDTSSPPQNIYRISRNSFGKKGSLTPILSNVSTKEGVTYYVFEAATKDYFPVEVGFSYKETMERYLSDGYKVIAINDPEYDYKELVAELTNGSHFSVFESISEVGKSIILLSITAEGYGRNNTRDQRGRVLGLHELECGKVDIQELIAFSSFSSKYERARKEAVAQDINGFIYFFSSGTQYGDAIFKGKLNWIEANTN